jgi:hypothetical protein
VSIPDELTYSFEDPNGGYLYPKSLDKEFRAALGRDEVGSDGKAIK